MKRCCFFLLAFLCFLTFQRTVLADSPGYGGSLRLRTEYSCASEAEKILPVIRQNIDSAIDALDGVVLVDRGFEYITRVEIVIEESLSGNVFVELYASVIDISGGLDNVVYETRKTGFINELGRLCYALVRRLDGSFFVFRRPKTAGEMDERIDSFFRRKKAAVSETQDIDLDKLRERQIQNTIKDGMGIGTVDSGMAEIDKDRAGELVFRLSGRRLSKAEKDFAADYPAMVPKIAEITEYALFASSSAGKRDPNFPEAAYRQVLWSYLLTREFGPDNAKIITDTHKVGQSGNTPGQKTMYFNNCRAGIGYALQNVVEDDIPEKVLTDPGVIKSVR